METLKKNSKVSSLLVDGQLVLLFSGKDDMYLLDEDAAKVWNHLECAEEGDPVVVGLRSLGLLEEAPFSGPVPDSIRPLNLQVAAANSGVFP